MLKVQEEVWQVLELPASIVCYIIGGDLAAAPCTNQGTYIQKGFGKGKGAEMDHSPKYTH